MRLIHLVILNLVLAFSVYAVVTILNPYEDIDYSKPNAYTFDIEHDDCYCPKYWDY